MTEPLVSIACITYNQSKYINKAIDGFLMQKTSFPYEIIIHDDASTDSTDQIIKEYELKHPDIIFPIYQNENQYSKGTGKILTNFLFPKCRGKYIALCEGDDYWIDPNKLQKQVDFLEANPEYSMCFHGAKVISEIETLNDSLFTDLEDRDYNSDELLKIWTVPTASIVFRNEFTSFIPQNKKFLYGDIIIILAMANHGKIRCINELMSVYRRTLTGVVLSNKLNYSYYSGQVDHYKEISHCFPKVSKTTTDKLIIYQYSEICLRFLKYGNLTQFIYNFLKFLKEYRYNFVIGFISDFYNSIKIKFFNIKRI